MKPKFDVAALRETLTTTAQRLRAEAREQRILLRQAARSFPPRFKCEGCGIQLTLQRGQTCPACKDREAAQLEGR